MPPLRIIVLISGGGTTLANLIQARESGQLQAEIVHVISSNPNAAGLKFAEQQGIPATTIERKKHPDNIQFSQAIFDLCRREQVDFVVLGGFLKKLVIPSDYVNRVINIHPSLIPAFCGQGMFGMNVHRAVIEYGCKLSGCTVHFVDNEYDHGPIIAQVPVEVHTGDTAEQLAARIFQAECQIYPEVINALAQQRLTIEQRQVSLRPPSA
jgi:phosphoribosylglycinamide formyltransferase-1